MIVARRFISPGSGTPWGLRPGGTPEIRSVGDRNSLRKFAQENAKITNGNWGRILGRRCSFDWFLLCGGCGPACGNFHLEPIWHGGFVAAQIQLQTSLRGLSDFGRKWAFFVFLDHQNSRPTL
jgi:hypothetical protein